MNWNIDHDAAWIPIGPGVFRHYCGATIRRHGPTWTAITATYKKLATYKSAIDAVTALSECRSVNSFWHFKQFGDQFGRFQYGTIEHRTRPFRRGHSREVFIFRSPNSFEIPTFLKTAIEERFSGIATCMKCGIAMSGARSRVLSSFDGFQSEPTAYLVCFCDHPVWEMDQALYDQAELKISQLARIWRRQQALKVAGGRHSKQEVATTLALQLGLCIYCNTKFTDENRWDEDHIIPVTKGGSNWALNIVLACRKCNRRRGNMPFLTFCKLLDPAQNQRILSNLQRRVSSAKAQCPSEETMRTFLEGIRAHDPDDWRFLNIQRTELRARRNANRNRILSFDGCMNSIRESDS